MAVDVSTLGIVVKSDGIKEATSGLNKLAKAADRAEVSTGKLEKSSGVVSNTLNGAGNAAGTFAGKVNGVVGATQLAAQSINKLNSQLNGTSSASAKATASGNMFHGVLRNMLVAANAYMGVNLVKNIVESGDAWQSMQARLKIATGSMENARVVQQDLFELAQNLRVPLADTTRLYTRMADPMRELGKTSKETMSMVESVALALQLSGATGAEASSVMLQFSQSINAGRLNGAEFNAVAEGAPIILKALEIQTGKTRGELKKMGADGKISVELLSDALEKQKAQWLKDFGELPVTFDGAMTRLKNSWLKAMGEMNESTGLNRGLIEAVKTAEELIPVIRDEMVAAFVAVAKWIKENKEGIAETWKQVKGLVGDVWNLAGAFLGVAGQVAGAGNEINAFGFAVYSLRLMVAGLSDGFTFISGILMKMGALAYKVLVTPFVIAATAVGQLSEKVGLLLGAWAQGASAVGLTTLGDSLQSASSAALGATKSVKDFSAEALTAANSLDEMGNNAFKMLANSEGAVGKLINGTDEAAKAIQKLNKGAYTESPDLAKNAARAKAKAAEEAGAKAAKEAAKVAKKAEADRVNSIKAYVKEMENANDKITEQTELSARLKEFGLDYDKLTSGEKLVIKLTADLNAEKRESVQLSIRQALASAQELAALERKNEAEVESLKNARDLKIARDTANNDMMNVDKQYNRDIAGMTLGDKAKADMEAVAAIEDKFQAQRRELDKSNSEKKIDNYDEQLAVITQNQQWELDRYKTHTEAKKALDADWMNGAKRAFANYQEEAADVAGMTEKLFSNAFQGLEDALVGFVTTGKLSFSDLTKSILTDLAKMATKAATSGLFNMLVNFGMSYVTGTNAGVAGDAGGGMDGGGMGGGGVANALGGVYNGGVRDKFATGGAFSNGVVDKPTAFNRDLMGEAGPEAIVPLTRTSDGSLGIKQVNGSTSDGSPIHIEQTFIIGDSGDGTSDQSTSNSNDTLKNQFATQMAQVARAEIEKSTRQGGTLWKIKNGR